MHLLDLAVDGPRVHPLLPVGEVAVADEDRHRAAKRPSVTDPRGHLGAVGLDLHAPAATVPELPPGQIAIQVLRRQLEAGRQPLEHRHETGAVRLAGGRETQGHFTSG